MFGRVLIDYDENLDVAGNGAVADWLQDRPDGYHPSLNLKPTQQVPHALSCAGQRIPRNDRGKKTSNCMVES